MVRNHGHWAWNLVDAIRTLRGWAICVLQEAHAIRECEQHGWVSDRADRSESTAVSKTRVDAPTSSPAATLFRCVRFFGRG
ncbi:hypothetical protein [Bradyrhizobium sp. AZCC 1699]|uniref:hypothetical protein n=1 Tax=unclassified Bradyrhizobium TaxID=2631580 RepID=UPI003FA55B4A